jgi:hypothetical protein
MQLTVVDLKARIVRLGRLERGFAPGGGPAAG